MDGPVSLPRLLLLFMGAVMASSIKDESIEGATKSRIHLLVYETEHIGGSKNSPAQRLVDQANDNLKGITATLFGQDNQFDGYGSKFSSVLPILRRMEIESKFDDSIIVISDSRDVLINNPYNDEAFKDIVADEFILAYDELTFGHAGSIIVSAEAQCCVSALTHADVGSYYKADGSRNKHACLSGGDGCLWAGDDRALPWENFMEGLMINRTKGIEFEDAYLNAGLMAGKIKDLIRVIQTAQIMKDEDDQAVLTDYMYHYPQDIVLDYNQKMFGNNRGGLSVLEGGGCIFEKHPDQTRLVHIKTGTTPLFLHSPGGFFRCHDQMAAALGVPEVDQSIRRALRQRDLERKLECNYGSTNHCGSCVNTGCDDNNKCTIDSCDPISGTCCHDAVTCPTGQSCDPNDGICKNQDLLVPCVAVIDESDNFDDSVIDDKWSKFRKKYPSRQFCLLRPRQDGLDYLHIPDAFLTDPNAVFADVTREDGNGIIVGSVKGPVSDWYKICKLDQITSGIQYVGLFIDGSGSMTTTNVIEAAYLFSTKVNKRFTISSVNDDREDWITPFMTTLIPG